MKQIYSIGLLVVLILQSCGTNDVVSKRIIQKRKYNKGFHIANRGNLNSEQKKVQSDEDVYSYDHHSNAQLTKIGIDQERRDLLEEKTPRIDHRKADKIKERGNDNINRIGSSTIKYEQNYHREEQNYRVENEKTLDISKFSPREERTGEAEPVAPDVVQRRSKIIRLLSIVSIALASAGLTFFLLGLLFSVFSFYGAVEVMFVTTLVFYGIAALLALSVLILFFCQPKDRRSRQDKKWTYSALLAPLCAISATFSIVYLIFLGF